MFGRLKVAGVFRPTTMVVGPESGACATCPTAGDCTAICREGAFASNWLPVLFATRQCLTQGYPREDQQMQGHQPQWGMCTAKGFDEGRHADTRKRPGHANQRRRILGGEVWRAVVNPSALPNGTLLQRQVQWQCRFIFCQPRRPVVAMPGFVSESNLTANEVLKRRASARAAQVSVLEIGAASSCSPSMASREGSTPPSDGRNPRPHPVFRGRRASRSAPFAKRSPGACRPPPGSVSAPRRAGPSGPRNRRRGHTPDRPQTP